MPGAASTEIARFLAARPPFDVLDPDELHALVADTELEFHLQGELILTEDGGPVTFLRVIYSGAVELVHEGRLLDLLTAGAAFGQAAMLAGLPPGFEARAAEDTLCYRIPVAAARPLLDRARSREIGASARGVLDRAVAQLIRSPTLRCEPEVTVVDAARRMTEQGATCAVIEQPDGSLGILTDRDLRSRVLAAELSPRTPVAEVMTTPVYSVPPDRLGAEVMFEMLERGIRHVPVRTRDGRLIGVLEDGDLIALQPRSWFTARRAVERASSPEELAEVGRMLPQTVLDLFSAGARPLEVARVLTALADSLIIRAIEIARGESSSPLPDDGIVWVALGSHARRELSATSLPRSTLLADADPPKTFLTWLAKTLRASGLPPSLAIHRPDDPLPVEVVSEHRPVWGTPRSPLPVLDPRTHRHVLDELARRAREATPPTGFEGNLVVLADGTRVSELDLAEAGMRPLVALARWAGAAAGTSERSTPARLDAAAAHGVLESDDARTLREAFEVAFGARMTEHAAQLSDGTPARDRIDPATMSQLTRDALRDVFHAVAAVQRRVLG